MLHDLERTLTLLEQGARGESSWCKRAQGSKKLRRVWVWRINKALWIGSGIVLFCWLFGLIK
jgi:hypothetical protein